MKRKESEMERDTWTFQETAFYVIYGPHKKVRQSL